MEPNTKKLIRGTIYTVAMGIVTMMVLVQGAGEFSVLMGAFYIMGALLVFGVDIKHIRLGPIEIQFETARRQDRDRES